MTSVRSWSVGTDGYPTVDVPVPSGAAIGDIMLAVCTADSDVGTLTPPSGWTQFDQQVQKAPNGQTSAVFWKRLTAVDTGVYTFGLVYKYSGTSVAIVCVSGADATNPPTISVSNVNTVANPSPIPMTANGVTALAGDALIYLAALDANGQQAFVFESPLGFSDAGYISANKWDVVYSAYKLGAIAGDTGPVTATAASPSAGGYQAWLVRVPAATAAVAAPVANAGPDQVNIDPGSTVTLAGSATNSPTSFAWTQTSGTPVTLSSTTSPNPTFTAPANAAGQTLIFSLVATNATGPSVADSVTISVLPQLEWIAVSGAWAPTKSVVL